MRPSHTKQEEKIMSNAPFHYLPGVSSLTFLADRCRACGACLEVCPRQVFSWRQGNENGGRRVEVIDKDACIECGACARNCPHKALQLTPGAGCATLIIAQWLDRCGWKRRRPKSGCC